ncbi:MAG: TatD family hydrolase [Pirellulales bacterium]
MLFDTHCHLDQDEFDADRDEVVNRAVEAGVGTIIAVGTTATSSEKCIRIAGQFDSVYAAVGIQPNYVAEAGAGDWDRVVEMADHGRVVAIGETGLDRHWDYSPFDQQQDFFDRHLRLSQQKDMAFIVHMRDCEADVMAMLRDARGRGPLRGVIHSFTGDAAMAAECVELGTYISFAGMVTFKKSDALRQCAAGIPMDRLLIETDAPYLSPHPVRSQRRNEPANLRHTAECLADVRELPLEELARQTTANARRLFKLDSHEA